MKLDILVTGVGGQGNIPTSVIIGRGCTASQQICPRQAIGSETEIKAGKTK